MVRKGVLREELSENFMAVHIHLDHGDQNRSVLASAFTSWLGSDVAYAKTEGCPFEASSSPKNRGGEVQRALHKADCEELSDVYGFYDNAASSSNSDAFTTWSAAELVGPGIDEYREVSGDWTANWIQQGNGDFVMDDGSILAVDYDSSSLDCEEASRTWQGKNCDDASGIAILILERMGLAAGLAAALPAWIVHTCEAVSVITAGTQAVQCFVTTYLASIGISAGLAGIGNIAGWTYTCVLGLGNSSAPALMASIDRVALDPHPGRHIAVGQTARATLGHIRAMAAFTEPRPFGRRLAEVLR